MKQKNHDVVYGIKKRIEHWQIISIGLAVYDMLAICAAFFGALLLRFDCSFSMIPQEYLMPFYHFIGIYVLFAVFVFWRLRLYNSIWRFASFDELLRMSIATGITFVFHCVGITVFFQRMPLSYYVFGIILQFALTLGIRFSYRFILLERERRGKNLALARANHVLLIGAGSAGRMLLQDIRKAEAVKDRVCCIIDDNPNKWGRFIDGIPIEGGRDSIFSCVKKYHIDKIYIAIPSATPQEKRDILNICKETGCELKNLPGMYQLVTGEISANALQDVAVEDLLGRDPIKVNDEEICQYIREKVCLVSGGGGSIGSELCRQIAAYEPKQLIIFDIYENNAYEIQQELKKKYPDLNLVVLIGSVRDTRRTEQVFRTYHPDIVYHAAAHKHVPLMENSPCEAIKNNVMGTYKMAFAAMLYGCQRFVLISTDKAVNPTNIMGASKRICEMIIQSFDQKVKMGRAEDIPVIFTHHSNEFGGMDSIRKALAEARTEFVAVRFGNVLGSNGSVVPLFKKQIAEGGPVTVTHPDIIRYFMTIPEAVSLVMQAGGYASGGEIFVLDMGDPVKIDTLARNLIKLTGYKPDVDIMIEYIGLRPGEKLYEEKLMAEEGLQKTKNEMIHIGKPIAFDMDVFLHQLKELMHLAYLNDDGIQDAVAGIVNTYYRQSESMAEYEMQKRIV